MFAKTAKELGYHPYVRPTANASQPYTNPDGMKIGQCQYCGFCERFGCEANAKGSPHITVIPVALRNPNVELRTHCWATKVMLDSTGKKATGIAYVNTLTGEELEQPADLVILAAYGLSNVHLMLLSGIGKPYDPNAQTGVIGKNYAYQGGSNVALFFEGKSFNPFIATGAQHLDRRFPHQLGFRPQQARLCRRLLHLGRWLARTADHLSAGAARHAAMGLGGSATAYQGLRRSRPAAWRCPTATTTSTSIRLHKNRFGQPLMRMTFDFKDQRMNRHSAEVIGQIARAMNPTTGLAERAHDLERRPISRPTRAAPSWAPIRATARSTSICRAGRFEPVRHRRLGVPAQPGQSHRSGRRARLLDGGRHPRKISQEPDRWSDHKVYVYVSPCCWRLPQHGFTAGRRPRIPSRQDAARELHCLSFAECGRQRRAVAARLLAQIGVEDCPSPAMRRANVTWISSARPLSRRQQGGAPGTDAVLRHARRTSARRPHRLSQGRHQVDLGRDRQRRALAPLSGPFVL
jgi:choline dehydrogenase-like flavoprotein